MGFYCSWVKGLVNDELLTKSSLLGIIHSFGNIEENVEPSQKTVATKSANFTLNLASNSYTLGPIALILVTFGLSRRAPAPEFIWNDPKCNHDFM